MKIQQLAYFVETYKYQNMSIASRKLLVLQPSISAAIRELEQEFDTPLFHRQGKRLLPTKEGDTLYALSLQLFEQIDIISKTMKEMKRANNTIRLGIPPMIDALLLTPVLKTFMTQHPEVKLSIYEQGSGSLAKAFQSDVIDCAFITHIAPIAKELMFIPITNIEVVFCTHRAKRALGYPDLDIQSIAKLPLVLFNEDFLITQEAHKRFIDAGIAVNSLNAFYTDQLSTVENFIEHDIASGFLYRPIAEQMKDVTVLSCSPPLFIQSSLVWKEGFQKYAPMKQFIRYIQRSVFDGII